MMRFSQTRAHLADERGMERRIEPRYACHRPVVVTCLSGPHRVLDGMFADISGRGANILIPEPIPVNTAIRIDADDVLLLGDVCRCRAEGEGYAIGVQLAHAVGQSAVLLNLLASLRSAQGSVADAVGAGKE